MFCSQRATVNRSCGTSITLAGGERLRRRPGDERRRGAGEGGRLRRGGVGDRRLRGGVAPLRRLGLGRRRGGDGGLRDSLEAYSNIFLTQPSTQHPLSSTHLSHLTVKTTCRPCIPVLQPQTGTSKLAGLLAADID